MEAREEFERTAKPEDHEETLVLDKAELFRGALKTEQTADFSLEALIDWSGK